MNGGTDGNNQSEDHETVDLVGIRGTRVGQENNDSKTPEQDLRSSIFNFHCKQFRFSSDFQLKGLQQKVRTTTLEGVNATQPVIPLLACEEVREKRAFPRV